MYSYFRRIRHIGRIRAWYASKVDRVTWNEVCYPLPPEMRHPGMVILSGSWADITPSYIRVDRYSYKRKKVIESRSKVKRLRKRRAARRYRAYHKRTGQW